MAKYKGKTIEKWMDLQDKNKIYDVGSIYETDNKQRFDEILGNNAHNKAFIEVIEDKDNDYEALTVDEIKKELDNREVDYDSNETLVDESADYEALTVDEIKEELNNREVDYDSNETLVDESADYEALTVDEIKEELNNREVEYDSKLKKAELIEVLKDSDSE